MAAPPIATMFQFAQGYQTSQILYAVAKYGFADMLKDGPKSGEELAKMANTDPENTTRTLRAAAAIGIVDRNPETLAFSLNDTSKLLLDDGPTSFKWIALHLCAPDAVYAWSNLEKTIVDRSPAYKEANGMPVFEYYEKKPELGAIFSKAMTAMTLYTPVAGPLATLYNFKDAKHVVDVGGSHGTLLNELLRQHPHLTGTSFDLPHVVEDAKNKKAIDFTGIESRFSFAAGSFFESVPSGGDIYLLKFIIHDWDDVKAAEILKTVVKAMPENGKVVVLEQVIQETGDVRGSLLDLHMMCMCDAKERTETQYHNLFKNAGLKITKIIPLAPTFYSAIEGVKI